MASRRRDGLASFLGIVVFLAGVVVIFAMFSQAWSMFTVAPRLNLGIETGQPINFSVVGVNLARLIVKILLLVVMTGIGSVLANRGVKLYASGRPVHDESARGGTGDSAS